jgi:hypothetical protein
VRRNTAVTSVAIILTVVALGVTAIVAGYIWLATAQRRALRAISAVLAEFAEGVNQANLGAVNRLMLPERRDADTVEQFAADFPGRVVNLELLRAQITRVRAAEGQPYNGLGKILVQVQVADGPAGNAVFLLARTGKQWQISDWVADAEFDMVDYHLE